MLDIKKNSAEHDLWLRWYRTTAQTSFFESPFWYKLWSNEVQAHGFASQITSYWAKKVILGIPILHAAPLHTYGAVTGFFDLNCLPKDASYFLTLNPFRKHHFLPSLSTQTQDTHYFDLNQSNDDFIARLPKKKRDNLKSSLKKSLKSGIMFSTSDALTDWVHFQTLYRQTTQRWNAPSKIYDTQDFERIHSLNANHRALFLAHQNNEPVAGAICFFSKDICSFWLSAANTQGLKSGAVYGLVYHILNHARDSGRRIFDLLPSGKNPGVESFKQNLGSSPLSVHFINHWHPIHNIAHATKSLFKF